MPLLSSSLTIGLSDIVTLTSPDTGVWGYEVAPGANVSFTNEGMVAVVGDTDADALVNAPVIGFYQPFGAGQNSLFWNRAGAVFRVTAIGIDGDAFGVRGGGGFIASVTNDGLMEVIADRGAFGVYDFAGEFINSGTLRVTAGGNALGAGFGGSFSNSGVIEVTGGGGVIGVNVQADTSSLDNSGQIIAISTGALASIGVALFNATGSELTVVNTSTGLVKGDFAFKEIQILVTAQLARQVVENAGTARGAIDLGLGDDELHNTGGVYGYVALGQGADLYHGGGVLRAPVFGGFGDDTIFGGAGRELLYGEENNDQIDGGAGADTIDGGHDDDSLSGGNGADKLFGGYGDDVIVGGAGDDELDGWEGADTLEGDAGADVIVISFATYSTGAEFDTALGFDFAEDKIRIPTPPTVIDTAITSGGLSNAAFAVDLANAVSPGSLGAGGAVIFTPDAGDYAGSAFLIIDANGVAGYQDGADIVIRLQSAANLGQFGLTNFQAGPSFYDRLPLEFTSSPLYGEGREIYGDFTIHEGESLDFALQGETRGLSVLNLNFPPPVTVTNAGDFFVHAATGDVIGVGATEISPEFDLTLFNTSTGRVRIEASAGDAGGGSVRQFLNDGLFEVIAAGGGGGVGISPGPNSKFANSGILSVVSTANATGVSIGDYSFKATTFDNSGEIQVSAGVNASVAVGVDIFGVTASFNNSGTIRVESVSPGIESAAIVFVNFLTSTEQVFLNSGLIEGDWAIREKSQYFTTQTTREILINTGAIHGKISLGDGADVIRNQGELAGDVDLGKGRDYFDSRNGAFSGAVASGGGNDTILGDAFSDQIDAGAGDDVVDGGGGNDQIDARDGNDVVAGQSGHDAINGGVGNDAIDLGAGDDVANGGVGKDSILGGSGFDSINGGAGNDTLTGGTDGDTLDGGAGFDVLQGDAGDDVLNGGASNDVIFGNAGNDRIEFNLGGGVDTLRDFTAGAASEDTIRLVGFGAAFDTFSEVIAAATDNGVNTTIDFGGGDILIIRNVLVSELHADDFSFG